MALGTSCKSISKRTWKTSTLPHKKYYDYDKWEMEEYQKQQSVDMAKASASSVLLDQRRHDMEKRAQADRQRKEEMALTQTLMNRDKVMEMKRQADMRVQMQTAYKTGDMETYNRLKERLG